MAVENTEPGLTALPFVETENYAKNSDKELSLTPKCEDIKLYEKTLAKIQDYFSSIATTSTISKRQKALLMANIDGFENINIKDITPQTDIYTANALITLKVNKHLKNADFVVCKQIGKSKLPLYLIGYPEANNYMVHIINLDPYSSNYDKISFTYP